MRHGRCWLQGKVVRCFPCCRAQCLQCLHQQLVERTLSAPSEGLPEVCVCSHEFSIHIIELLSDTTSSRHFVRTILDYVPWVTTDSDPL